jgi:predicted transcriptional regulator YheO
MKDAVVKVADYLGISKNTVYMHIRNVGANTEKKSE